MSEAALPYSEQHKKVTAPEAFESIATSAKTVLGNQQTPVIVYDLDGTLFDNRSRQMKIITDLLVSPDGQRIDPKIQQKIIEISARKIRYRIVDTLRDVGVNDEELLDWFLQGWKERFFTNEYVLFDLPTPGAVDFVKRTSNLGIKTVYLTGRDTPGMRPGTERALSMFEFPAPRGEECALITKPTFEMSDFEYKSAAIDEVKSHGEVIAVFDNEPKAMNIMARAFLDADAYFLNSLWSPDIEPLDDDVLILDNFRLPPKE